MVGPFLRKEKGQTEVISTSKKEENTTTQLQRLHNLVPFSGFFKSTFQLRKRVVHWVLILVVWLVSKINMYKYAICYLNFFLDLNWGNPFLVYFLVLWHAKICMCAITISSLQVFWEVIFIEYWRNTLIWVIL